MGRFSLAAPATTAAEAEAATAAAAEELKQTVCATRRLWPRAPAKLPRCRHHKFERNSGNRLPRVEGEIERKTTANVAGTPLTWLQTVRVSCAQEEEEVLQVPSMIIIDEEDGAQCVMVVIRKSRSSLSVRGETYLRALKASSSSTSLTTLQALKALLASFLQTLHCFLANGTPVMTACPGRGRAVPAPATVAGRRLLEVHSKKRPKEEAEEKEDAGRKLGGVAADENSQRKSHWWMVGADGVDGGRQTNTK